MSIIGNVGSVQQDNNAAGFANRNDTILNTLPSVVDQVKNLNPSKVANKQIKPVGECQTCKNRRYQDVSDDPGVSFKSPTKISPGQSAGAVMGHEREHYNREEQKARSEGRDVVSNSIRIYTGVCPECGKSYVSGGETRTITAKRNKPFSDGADSDNTNQNQVSFNRTV